MTLPEFRICPEGFDRWRVEIKVGENTHYKDGGWFSQKEVVVTEVWEHAYKSKGSTYIIAKGARAIPSPYYDARDRRVDRYEPCVYSTEKECEEVIDNYLCILNEANAREEAIRTRLATVKPRRYP